MFLDQQLSHGHEPVIRSVQMVMRESIYGFQGNEKNPYLKITVNDPRAINRLRGAFESKDGNLNYKGYWKAAEGGVMTFDNLQYVLRFMVDTKVSLTDAKCPQDDCNWFRYPVCRGWRSQLQSTKFSHRMRSNQLAKLKRIVTIETLLHTKPTGSGLRWRLYVSFRSILNAQAVRAFSLNLILIRSSKSRTVLHGPERRRLS